jgi:hypothetical protein
MRSTSRFFAALVALATLAGAAAPAFAQGGMCQQLWVERNSIYKARGYCFKTARAVAYFGNAGCAYDAEAAVPLSGGERARINEIQRMERANGCR